MKQYCFPKMKVDFAQKVIVLLHGQQNYLGYSYNTALNCFGSIDLKSGYFIHNARK